MIPVTERTLIRLWWVDATNRAGGWHAADDLAEFATNGAWEASNTGWLVYEDDRCYVLAGRMTDDGENVGLVERIPKAAVTRKEVLAAESAQADGDRAGTPITSAVLRKRAAILEDEAHTLMADTSPVLRSKVRSPEHLLVIAAEFAWLADEAEGLP